jgi:hydroxymethylpyrimidine/phosphomethylpyrimidine kinase
MPHPCPPPAPCPCPLQNTQGVLAVHVAPTDFIRAQISAVLSDIGADVVKTGMLPTPEVGDRLLGPSGCP